MTSASRPTTDYWVFWTQAIESGFAVGSSVIEWPTPLTADALPSFIEKLKAVSGQTNPVVTGLHELAKEG